MAKVTKTYFSRTPFRRFYRRYFRRNNVAAYNRISNNYMFGKFMMPFKLRPNGSNAGRYQFDFLASNDPSNSNFDVMDYIKSCPEYVRYISLFNEVKLLGVGIKLTPIIYEGVTSTSNVAIGWSMEQVGQPQLANVITCNPTSSQYKYVRNFSRKYVPTDQTQSVIQQGNDMTFRISTNSQTSNQDVYGPRWTLELYFYMRFRKNASIA